MKIFLSWSGPRSHDVAKAFDDFLPLVIQSVQPWISSSSISKGSTWQAEMVEQLESISFGIVCLTPENRTHPWILFEAGALSKTRSSSATVATVLYELKPSDIEFPLAQFQHTTLAKEDVRALVSRIASAVVSAGGTAPPPDRLQVLFDTFWPRFEGLIGSISAPLEKPPVTKRSSDSMLAEILESVRAIQSALPLRAQPELTAPEMSESLKRVLGLTTAIRSAGMGPTGPVSQAAISALESALNDADGTVKPTKTIRLSLPVPVPSGE